MRGALKAVPGPGCSAGSGDAGGGRFGAVRGVMLGRVLLGAGVGSG